MGNRLTTFQNLLEQQLRSLQSIVVHLVRIEEVLGDIRDGRVLATTEFGRLASIIEEESSDNDTLNSSPNSNDFLDEAIV